MIDASIAYRVATSVNVVYYVTIRVKKNEVHNRRARGEKKL